MQLLTLFLAVDDDLSTDMKPVSTDTHFALFDDLKKKVDLSQESTAVLNEYQPLKVTENPYEI